MPKNHTYPCLFKPHYEWPTKYHLAVTGNSANPLSRTISVEQQYNTRTSQQNVYYIDYKKSASAIYGDFGINPF